MVEGKLVRPEYDPANAVRGHKDNTEQRTTLAYVYLQDGTLPNAEIIGRATDLRSPGIRSPEWKSFGNWSVKRERTAVDCGPASAEEKQWHNQTTRQLPFKSWRFPALRRATRWRSC
jgi:hypothetical protein